MKTSVLIPVKSLAHGKSRLAKVLSDSHRELLIVLLFKRMVEMIKKSKNDVNIFVVSNDAVIIKLANTFHINHIYEKHPGHNRALTEAAKQLDPAIPLLTISADLPFITEKDITALISLIGEKDAVLVPSKEKTGTNAVLVKKPLLIPYLFGKQSFSKFTEILQGKSIAFTTFYSESLAFDIDTAQDLALFKSKIQNRKSVLHKFYFNGV